MASRLLPPSSPTPAADLHPVRNAPCLLPRDVGRRIPEAALASEHPDQDFEALIRYIQERRGLDFRGYKRTSLRRRITLRMTDVGAGDFAGPPREPVGAVVEQPGQHHADHPRATGQRRRAEQRVDRRAGAVLVWPPPRIRIRPGRSSMCRSGPAT